MKSHLRNASSLVTTSTNKKGRRKSKFRKSARSKDTSYELLERRNLLATITVTTADDSLADDGLVSLREAIIAANTNAAFGDAPAGDATGDVIVFDASLANQTLQLELGQMDITDDLRIVGSIGNTTIDAQEQSRFFEINRSAEEVQIVRLNLINGSSGLGGAILLSSSSTDLRIVESNFINNEGSLGGAILGAARIEQSTFIDNEARWGGAIYTTSGELHISQSVFRNSFAAFDGGAILSFAETLIEDSSFIGNRARDDGGAFSGGSDTNPFTGALANDNLSIFRSIFNNNTAGEDGGAIFLPQPRSLISDTGAVEFNVVESTFNGNSSIGDGGAIFAVDVESLISESTFAGNSSRNDGGAIFHSDLGQVDIRDSRFANNFAQRDGGAFAIRDRGSVNQDRAGDFRPVVNVTNSVFTGNIAGDDPTNFTFSSGGAFSNIGGLLFIADSVITNNSTTGSGGGISAQAVSNGPERIQRVFLTNTIVSGNSAQNFGGGISTEGVNLTIFDSRIINNRVEGPLVSQGTTTDRVLGGGGVFSGDDNLPGSSDVSVVFIRNTLFQDNFASLFGGGLANEDTVLGIVNSTFRQNNVTVTAASTESTHAGGGGVYHRRVSRVDANLTVSGSSFVQNRVSFGEQALGLASEVSLLGGGLSVSSFASARITNTDFFRNSSDGSGGGIGLSGSGTLRLVNNDFAGNFAGTSLLNGSPTGAGDFGTVNPIGLGGAVYTSTLSSNNLIPVRIFGGEFRGNFSTNSGGAIFSQSVNRSANVLLRANTEGVGTRLLNNRALRQDGGAFASFGIGLNARDAFFSTNSARNGGALFVQGADDLRLVTSEFRRNAARARGGAVNVADAVFADFDNIFANNTAIVGPDIFENV